MRVGVNCGSVDPAKVSQFGAGDSLTPMLESALEHCDFLDSIGFQRYCVSLKDSDPTLVVQVNQRFSAARPEIPLHLGVTEAGMPPAGVIKTRLALVPLLQSGIGDTIRVSLTVPNDRKDEEIAAGQQILEDVDSGSNPSALVDELTALNIISCPSCSRVENEAFIELAERVKKMTEYARDYPISIAVMGCRVNGPGETDDADLGLWCGPTTVNLKRGETTIGSFRYDEILDRLRMELDQLIAERGGGQQTR
jgi:(E)-4-hydroxy-3-methylbut-2-enyl-diphosphate synthase